MKTIYTFFTGVLMMLSGIMAFSQGDGQNSLWPKKFEAGNQTVVIYQPQVESLIKDKLEARAAVSVTTPDDPSPVFGAVWFDCRILTDYDTRMVSFKDLKVTAVKFPEGDQAKTDQLSQFLEQEMPEWNYEASLDELMLSLEDAQYQAQLAGDLNNAPPEIIFVTYPAVLVTIDGDPRFKDIENSGYSSVVNTPFFIVRDNATGRFYLKGGKYWYSSSNLDDDWNNIDGPPKKVKEIASKAMGQDEGKSSKDTLPQPVQHIFVSTHPAELLQSNGEPDYAPLEGTSLLYMKNTTDYILMDINKQEYYVLISGRWYVSQSLSGKPWKYVPADMLPADFARIPANSDMADVRASVAGTQEAKEAVLANQVPQTAEVDRKTASLEVNYDGPPKFQPIGQTGMLYAVNTNKSVLMIDGRYYCCDDAIWFESGDPLGPWSVCTSVPDKIQEIPPDNPLYNVKYVNIYDVTPDYVYMGYTPGYCYSYAYGPTVVYGTGFYYDPWYGNYYYPWPVTYGFGVNWNPYTGWGFSFGVGFGGPYDWFCFGWYPPYYGYWGPVGYRGGYYHGYHHGYEEGHEHGRYDSRNYYGPRGGTSVDNNIYYRREKGVNSGVRPSGRPSEGNRASTGIRNAARPVAPNNVITDKQGNVYRKNGENYQKRENGNWSNMDRTNKNVSPGAGNLDKEFQNRQRGESRTQEYRQNRSTYQQARPSGSYNRSAGVPSGGRSGSYGGGGSGGRRK